MLHWQSLVLPHWQSLVRSAQRIYIESQSEPVAPINIGTFGGVIVESDVPRALVVLGQVFLHSPHSSMAFSHGDPARARHCWREGVVAEGWPGSPSSGKWLTESGRKASGPSRDDVSQHLAGARSWRGGLRRKSAECWWCCHRSSELLS